MKKIVVTAENLIQQLLALDPRECTTMEAAMKFKWLQDDEMKKKVQKLMDEETKNLSIYLYFNTFFTMII